MSIIVEHFEDHVTMRIHGAFNFSVQKEFRLAYQEIPIDRPIYINMATVVHIDSSALGMLLLIREYAGGETAEIHLQNCSPEIENLLAVAQFQTLFTIHGGPPVPSHAREAASSPPPALTDAKPLEKVLRTP